MKIFQPSVPKRQPNLSTHTTRPRSGRRSGERSSQSCSCAGSFGQAKLLGQPLVQRVEILSAAPMGARTVRAVNSAVLLNRLQDRCLHGVGLLLALLCHPSLSRYRSTIGGTGETYRHDRKGPTAERNPIWHDEPLLTQPRTAIFGYAMLS